MSSRTRISGYLRKDLCHGCRPRLRFISKCRINIIFHIISHFDNYSAPIGKTPLLKRLFLPLRTSSPYGNSSEKGCPVKRLETALERKRAFYGACGADSCRCCPGKPGDGGGIGISIVIVSRPPTPELERQEESSPLVILFRDCVSISMCVSPPARFVVVVFAGCLFSRRGLGRRRVLLHA